MGLHQLSVAGILPIPLLDTKDQLFVSSLLALLLLSMSYSNSFPIEPISRVLVAQYDPILFAGIQKPLQEDETIVLRNIAAPDQITLLNEISSFRPHTVVLAGWSPLIDLVELRTILNELPQIRLIIVGLQDERLHIFEKKQLIIHKSDDIAYIVRN